MAEITDNERLDLMHAQLRSDDDANGRMDPGAARVGVAFVIVSLLALWGTVDLVSLALAWWWS